MLRTLRVFELSGGRAAVYIIAATKHLVCMFYKLKCEEIIISKFSLRFLNSFYIFSSLIHIFAVSGIKR